MRKTVMMRSLAAMVAAGVMSVAGVAAAQVPATITHQGRLYDTNDAPINTTLSVQFSVYDVASGGVALWTEVHQVTFDQGYFSVELGSTVPFDTTVFDGSVRWLGITVGNDAEMTPRAATRSVPYALLAGDVTGDINPSSVTINGTTVIDSTGQWVGDPTGLVGPQGPAGAPRARGAQGPTGAPGPARPGRHDGRQRPPGPERRTSLPRRARSTRSARWGWTWSSRSSGSTTTTACRPRSSSTRSRRRSQTSWPPRSSPRLVGEARRPAGVSEGSRDEFEP